MSRPQFEVIIRSKQDIVSLPGVSISELSRLCECQVTVARRLIEVGLLDPVSGGEEPMFDRSAVIRVRKALRLKRDLRLNLDAVALVMELLDRIEELERR